MGTAAIPGVCTHCGLPTKRPPEGETTFCCVGCRIAWRLVGPGGQRTGSESALWLVRICLGVVLTMIVMLIQWVRYLEPEAAATESYAQFAPWAQWIAATPVLLVVGLPYVRGAWAQLRAGRPGADVLIALGILASYGVSVATVLRGHADPLYFDTASGLATLVTVGRWLEASAKERASASLRAFLAEGRVPARRMAHADALASEDEPVSVETLRPGDLVRVPVGTQVPVDGQVVVGQAHVDEAALTGEPLPRAVGPGDTVRAPTVPVDGPLVVSAASSGEGTLLAEIGRVLAQARAERAPAERLADAIAAIFVPTVVVLALGVFVWRAMGDGVDAAGLHALSVLVIACPCALGIATPLAITAAMGQLARRGILVRSGGALDAAARVDTVACDKTGTLTEGRPRVERLDAPGDVQIEDALAWAASVEAGSPSPWALAIRDAAAARELDLVPATGVVTHPGRGIEGTIESGGTPRRIQVGSSAWLAPGTVGDPVVVTVDGQVALHLHLRDAPRPEAAQTLARLRAAGVDVRILSGDAPARVAEVAVELGLPEDAAEGGLLPTEKLDRIRALAQERPGALLFLGDGINDAPALAAADVGVAVGSGTDLAKESADVSLLGDDLARLPGLLEAAVLTRRGVRWNLFWAFLYNGLGVAWAVVFGLPPVLAALAMVLSSLCVIAATGRLRARLADDPPTHQFVSDTR